MVLLTEFWQVGSSGGPDQLLISLGHRCPQPSSHASVAQQGSGHTRVRGLPGRSTEPCKDNLSAPEIACSLFSIIILHSARIHAIATVLPQGIHPKLHTIKAQY